MRLIERILYPSMLLVLACKPTTDGLGDETGTGDETMSTGTEGECVGEAGCMCAPDGSCDPGLMCEGDMCVPEGGDGDGDPGDGDPGDGDPGDGDGDPACSMEGCMCDGAPDSCDPGLECVDGLCAPLCGNGVVDDGEACDDANATDADGCDSDCTLTMVSVAAGGLHSCAVIEGGEVRCWGAGALGSTGYGATADIGDDETPASAGGLTLPAGATQLELGGAFGCGHFDDDQLRCWGAGSFGQLGNADTVNLGDDEDLAGLAGLMFAGAVTSFDAGGSHACAVLDSGDLRCWGDNPDGRLGNGDNLDVGDDEGAWEGGVVMLGADAAAIVAAGGRHSCAVTAADELYCWGDANRGQLGYGNNTDIGDNETPGSAGPVDVYSGMLPANTTITQLALGKEHSCALFSSGDVVCWGRHNHGQLGYGPGADWGDGGGETPAMLTPLTFASPVIAISAGDDFNCALLDGGEVRCWGRNDVGQLGRGDNVVIGDDEPVTDGNLPAVDLGGAAIQISSSGQHSCAVLEDYSVLCWGLGANGRLGYANLDTIGDDETPASVGAITLLP